MAKSGKLFLETTNLELTRTSGSGSLSENRIEQSIPGFTVLHFSRVSLSCYTRLRE